MSSQPGARSLSAEFLSLTTAQQIDVVNNEYHVGNLGYFELPTGLELPDHGWHGGVEWGFRRSPAAEQNVVFERSPAGVAFPVSEHENPTYAEALDQTIGNIEGDINLSGAWSGKATRSSEPGDDIRDVARGISEVALSSIQHRPVPEASPSLSVRNQPTAGLTLSLPPRGNLHYDEHRTPFDNFSLPPVFTSASAPRPSPIDFSMAPIITDRGIFAPSTGPRPHRAKTHPATGSAPSSHHTAVPSKTTPSNISSTRHRSHSVLDPPRDLNHQVRTYTVSNPITGERIDLLDDDDYDPPTSYKLADIRPEDVERAQALGKLRCTRCRRWRPSHRFQHKHNRCVFCQARIDAGVWLVGNQKRKRADTIEECEEDDGCLVVDGNDPPGHGKRHHPSGGGFSHGGADGARNAITTS